MSEDRLLTLVVRVKQPEANWIWDAHMGRSTVDNGILEIKYIADGDTTQRPEGMYRNFYVCPRCGHRWEDIYECIPDDDCSKCGLRHISPDHSEDA